MVKELADICTLQTLSKLVAGKVVKFESNDYCMKQRSEYLEFNSSMQGTSVPMRFADETLQTIVCELLNSTCSN